MGIVVEPKEENGRQIAKERYLVRKEQMVSPKLLNADKYGLGRRYESTQLSPRGRERLAVNVQTVRNRKGGWIASLKGRDSGESRRGQIIRRLKQ